MGQGTKKVEQGTQTEAKTNSPDNDPDNGQFLNPGQGGQGRTDAWRPADDKQQGNSEQMEAQEPDEDDDTLDDEDEEFDDEEMDPEEDFEEDDDLDDIDGSESDILSQRGFDGSTPVPPQADNPGRNIY